MNKICGIYKITSPSGKIYIGQSIDIERRWEEHRKAAKIKKQSKISNSLGKYGAENHQFDIIEYCLPEDLNCSERFWQDQFDVLGVKGLNSLLIECNSMRRVVSEETKRTLSIINTGKTHTEDTRKKISKICKGIPKSEKEKRQTSERMKGKNNHSFGKIFSEEHRNKMANSAKNKKRPHVLVLDIQTGIFFYTIREASKAYGIHPSTLSRLLRSKSNSTNLIAV